MAKRTCWRCGTTYDSGEWGLGSCPVCAVDKKLKDHAEEIERTHEQDRETYRREQEKTRAAMEEAAFEEEMALLETEERQKRNIAEAEERQKRNIAEGWKLRAEAQAKRARELFDAGMYDDAIVHARRSIDEDRGYITGYMVASWALDKQGAHFEANQLYGKQIALLATDRYKGKQQLAEEVLNGLPADQALLSEFSRVVYPSLLQWKLTDCRQLIEELINRHVLDISQQMALLRRKDNSYPPELATFILDALPDDERLKAELFEVVGDNIDRCMSPEILLGMMIRRGFLREAQALLEHIEGSLLIHAYALEVANRLGASSRQCDVRLTNFLQTVSFGERWTVLRSLEDLQKRELLSPASLSRVRERIGERYKQFLQRISFGERWTVLRDLEDLQKGEILTPTILGQVKEGVAERYKQWEPEIQKEFVDKAWASAVASPQRRTKAAWVVGVAGCLIAAPLAAMALSIVAPDDRNELVGPVASSLVVGSLVLAGIASAWERARVRLRAHRAKLKDSLEGETQRWASLVDGRVERKAQKLDSPARQRAWGRGLVGALLIWLFLLVVISAKYDWTPETIGPTSILTITQGQGYILDMGPCRGRPGIVLDGDCYQNGLTVRVLSEDDANICISSKKGDGQCYKREEILRYAKLGTGKVKDYSRRLAISSMVFWVVGFPISSWIILATILR